MPLNAIVNMFELAFPKGISCFPYQLNVSIFIRLNFETIKIRLMIYNVTKEKLEQKFKVP